MAETQYLLDKFYRVEPHDESPTLYPYTDKYGEEHSPLVDFIYYHKMPELYRAYDAPLGKPLYRYLQSLYEGGQGNLVYSTVKGKRGIENLLDLINPATCPDEFLPYFCKSMGIDWFPDLITADRGTYYLRMFLCNIGEVYKRRGTESVVKYIAKVLTELEVNLRYNRVLNEDGTTKVRYLWVDLRADTPEQIAAVKLNATIIKRFIDTQIPYYITSTVNYILSHDAKIGKYHAGISTKVKRTAIYPTDAIQSISQVSS